MDEQRISDFQILQNELTNYWQMKRTLPVSLDEIKNEMTGFVPPKDPVTKAPYEYAVLEPLKFKLCTTFTQPSLVNSTSPSYAGYYRSTNEIWDHEVGYKCFERTIDPDLYPVISK